MSCLLVWGFVWSKFVQNHTWLIKKRLQWQWGYTGLRSITLGTLIYIHYKLRGVKSLHVVQSASADLSVLNIIRSEIIPCMALWGIFKMYFMLLIAGAAA